MTYWSNVYKVNEKKESNSLQYFFLSTGNEDIIKAVAYDFIELLEDSPLFNFGFGDYNIQTDRIVDSSNTNNGDVYTVFHTVLSTVPMFFELYPKATMVVQGSDNRNEFVEICKVNCRKNCSKICKNLNRRIRTYRNFVEKNFDKLKENYTFFGGINTEDGIIIYDNYEFGIEYDYVFCKRNVSLQNET